MALLKTYEALLAVKLHFEAGIPAAMVALGLKSRLSGWLFGRYDPENLPDGETGIITTIPERLQPPLGTEQTVHQFVDISYVVRDSKEEEVIRRQIGYGDATINLVYGDRTLGGAVFEATAWNPEIQMPAPGARMSGLTVVRLQIELNLLGG